MKIGDPWPEGPRWWVHEVGSKVVHRIVGERVAVVETACARTVEKATSELVWPGDLDDTGRPCEDCGVAFLVNAAHLELYWLGGALDSEVQGGTT